MKDFLELFLNKDGNFDSLLLLLLLTYANAGLFMWDLYQLVKKKTQWETLSVMLLPWAVSLMGGIMLAIFVNIPASKELEVFAYELESSRLSLEILGVVLHYVVLWGVLLLYQKMRNCNLKKWIVSCIPDYLYVLVVSILPIYKLLTGKNLFFELEEISLDLGFDFPVFLYIYLYAFMLLICKIVLFIVGLFVCFYSQKITFYKYKDTKNPVRFFLIYEIFCQNALLRGM